MSKFSWSYSRLKAWETCPLRFYHYNIVKDVKEEESAQQSEGHDVHAAFDRRIKTGEPLPMPLAHHEGMMSKLAAMPGETHTEMRLALTSEFKPTGWFTPKTWFRTIVDFGNVDPDRRQGVVLDYKTGRHTADETQLSLMSVTMMHVQPTIQRVRAMLLFVNNDSVERAEYTRQDIPRVWNSILPRVKKLKEAQDADEFPAKPSGLCVRYCSVTTCRFHGRGTQ